MLYNNYLTFLRNQNHYFLFVFYFHRFLCLTFLLLQIFYQMYLQKVSFHLYHVELNLLEYMLQSYYLLLLLSIVTILHQKNQSFLFYLQINFLLSSSRINILVLDQGIVLEGNTRRKSFMQNRFRFRTCKNLSVRIRSHSSLGVPNHIS